MSRRPGSAKNIFQGRRLDQQITESQARTNFRHQTKILGYKDLASKVSETEDTNSRQVIGFLLLAMTLSAGLIELRNNIHTNGSPAKTRHPRSSDLGANQTKNFDYEVSKENVTSAARSYNISSETLEQANDFLKQNPQLDLAQLAVDTARFDMVSKVIPSINDISTYVADNIVESTQQLLTQATAVGASAIAGLAASNHIATTRDLSAITSLAIAASIAFLPTADSKKIEKIQADLKRLEASAKKVGVFTALKSFFNYVIGWVPQFHEVQQDYKKNQYFIEFLKTSLSISESISEGVSLIRETLANEAYLHSLAFLEVAADFYGMDKISQKDRETIAKAIFAETSPGFDHNFFHLLAVPLVQQEELREYKLLFESQKKSLPNLNNMNLPELELAADNYRLLLQGTKDFLLKFAIPIKIVLGQDYEGNNPLHILAAVAPLDQFTIFFETFGDIIPKSFLEQKNKHGHSPLDILRSNDVQKEAINYISKTMRNNFIIDTSSQSISDALHQPDSLEVVHRKDVIVVELNGQKTIFPSYPKDAFVKRVDGNYDVMDLLNNKKLQTITAVEYNKIQDILPRGKSYAQVAFESREKKLQVLQDKKLESPRSQVEHADTQRVKEDKVLSRTEL